MKTKGLVPTMMLQYNTEDARLEHVLDGSPERIKCPCFPMGVPGLSLSFVKIVKDMKNTSPRKVLSTK